MLGHGSSKAGNAAPAAPLSGDAATPPPQLASAAPQSQGSAGPQRGGRPASGGGAAGMAPSLSLGEWVPHPGNGGGAAASGHGAAAATAGTTGTAGANVGTGGGHGTPTAPVAIAHTRRSETAPSATSVPLASGGSGVGNGSGGSAHSASHGGNHGVGAGAGGGAARIGLYGSTSLGSDYGGGGSGSLPSSPPTKGASASGIPPPALAALPAAAAAAAAGRRLQQLGQRLNFVGMVRKKHASFAPGVAGGGGGGGGGGGTLSGGEEGGPGGGGGAGGAGGGGGGGLHGGGGGHGAGHGGGGGGGGTSVSGVEAFNPPNHPVNPFSYLATPFRVMARTKAGAAMGRYATSALRLKRDGMPPASYMWLWLGNFKRWHRRYFVASEAPGVLLIYKRSNMQGKVWSTSLMGATVAQDEVNPRQIQLITPAGTIFLRVLRPEERRHWIACLNDSIATYRKHKEVVERVAAAAEGGEAGGAGVGGAVLPAMPGGGAVEQDAEQRRRIRQRTADRLAELAPLVAEVERHVGLLGSNLAAAAAGLGQLQQPLLPTSLAHAFSGRAARAPANSTASAAAAAAASAAAAAAEPPGGSGGGDVAAAIGASPRDSPSGAAIAAAAGGGGGASGAATPPGRLSLAGRRGELAPFGGMGGSGGGGGGGEAEGGERPTALLGLVARSRSRGRGTPVPLATPAPSLAAAIGGLVDAVRATLHNEAVRITALEAENAALNRALDILRSSTHRSGARGRATSGPGLGGGPFASAGAPPGGGPPLPRLSGGAAGGAAAALAAAADDGGSDAGSACTADEDAFDVVEAFDEGVDYSILDDDAPHGHRLHVGADDDEGPYAQHGAYPGGGTEEEEDDEDAAAEEAALAQQAEVLNALEVVRQVEYIAAAGGHGPLLAADAPPPPDAEEEEQQRRRGQGGKGRRGGAGKEAAGAGDRRLSGKGEDTDATLGEGDYEDEEEDDDDSETALSTGGAAGDTDGDGGGGGAGPAAPSPRRPYEGRCRLPAPKPLGRGFSIWGILKQAIGGDLTRITMPATINEPLSMTQRLAEPLENRFLLERAAVCPDPLDRLMLVSTWLLAGHNSQPLRDNKPFNPLLGETFEWQAPDGSARYFAEQVSHHPPVSCFVADGAGPQGYELYGEIETKTKFWGKAIDCILAGHMAVRLKAFDEEYRFNLGQLVINDVILGRFWVDLSSDIKIRNLRTGDTARLVIKPCRGYGYLEERGAAEAVVRDAAGNEVWRISGSALGSLHAALTPEAAAARGASPEPVHVWSREPELPKPTEQYCMTRFALCLNDPADPLVPHLPPTDVRFRPDMRALELGEWNRATQEKLRLEEKQRAARRARKEAGVEYRARWFQQVLPHPKEWAQPASKPGSVWAFTGEYWKAREGRAWGQLPDIY